MSVAFLCGPAGALPLVPCRQMLSNDGRFEYQGGELPLAEAQVRRDSRATAGRGAGCQPAPHRSLAARATNLASRAVASLPDAHGYLGVDLVLGEDLSGREDVVVEINPRLTTSYVGLRAALRPGTNLADAMLLAASGGSPQLSFGPDRVQFTSNGSIYNVARRSAS